MTKRPTHDTVTLTKIPRRDTDSLFLFNTGTQKPQIEPVSASKITKRICSFIPKIAAANQSLAEGSRGGIDVDVQKVANDTSSSDEEDTSDRIYSDDEAKSRVEFDLTLFRAKQSDMNGEVEIPQDVEALPEGFREGGGSSYDDDGVRVAKKLVEEL